MKEQKPDEADSASEHNVKSKRLVLELPTFGVISYVTTGDSRK